MTSEESNKLPLKERVKRLYAAFDAMSDGLGQAELDDMITAMKDKPRRTLSDLRGLGKDIGQDEGVKALERDRDE